MQAGQAGLPVPSSRGVVSVNIIPLKGWGCTNKMMEFSGNIGIFSPYLPPHLRLSPFLLHPMV